MQVEELENDAAKMNLPVKCARMPNKESVSCSTNSDNLKLSRMQSFRRRKATVDALKVIHCTPTSKSETPVYSGMWSTMMNGCTTKEVENLITTSKVCMDKVIPNVVARKVKEFEQSEKSIIYSATLLYKGGILSKRKYKDLRKEKINFMPEVSIPRPVSYNRLMSFVNSINMGTVIDLEVSYCLHKL